jgi:hypothetical protein
MTEETKINHIISVLKDIDVDGYTMQYILEQVGMEEQMLRQLVMSADNVHLRDLIKEKVELLGIQDQVNYI